MSQSKRPCTLTLEVLEERNLLSFSRVDYNLSGPPAGLAVGDFNHDGKPDVVVTNQATNSVSVLLGDGEGGFPGPLRSFPTGSHPTAVAVGDFNGDGKPDLVTLNDNGTVSLLLGNSDGTFRGPRDIAIGGNLAALAVADLRHNGKLDLVVTDYISNTIEVLLGNGDGSFQNARSYSVGTYPNAVAVGDLNGDGTPDLVVTDKNDDAVSVLLGNGDGSFQNAITSAAGPSPGGVALGDLNGGGRLDVVVSNTDSNSVSVLLGNGDGSFQSPQSYAVGTRPGPVVVGYFNDDAQLDVAVANKFDDSVSVLLGNGDGTLQPAQSYGTGSYPIGLAVSDFNRDGAYDLITANAFGNSLSLLLNQEIPQAIQSSLSTPDTLTARRLTPITVSATSVFGTTTSSYRDTIQFTSTDGRAVFYNGTTPLPGNSYTFTYADKGLHTFNVALGTPGPQTITVTDTTNPSLSPPPATVTVNPGAGDLDRSFGTAGKVTTDFGGDSRALAIALQDGNKMLVAGAVKVSSGDYALALARYNANGSLDTSFGNGGKVTTDLGSPSYYIATAVFQPDGKIVVGGSTQTSSTHSSFFLARYNANGSPDTAFGSRGKVTTDFTDNFGLLLSSGIGGLALQGDGKIVAVGEASYYFALARYNANGSPDTGFGSGGKVTTVIAGLGAYARSVVLQADGKMVVAGSYSGGITFGYSYFALARYNANGSLDTSFGAGGKVINDDPGVTNLALQADGKIVAVGTLSWFVIDYEHPPPYFTPYSDIVLERYNANGGLDSSFGSGGRVTTDFGDFLASSGPVALQTDGKMIVAGSADLRGPSQHVFFALARYNANGSLDAGFGAGGQVTTDFGSSAWASCVTFQADGKTIVAGSGGSSFDLARYLADIGGSGGGAAGSAGDRELTEGEDDPTGRSAPNDVSPAFLISMVNSRPHAIATSPDPNLRVPNLAVEQTRAVPTPLDKAQSEHFFANTRWEDQRIVLPRTTQEAIGALNDHWKDVIRAPSTEWDETFPAPLSK
jgi:uncharacterized delta-60 repeat protein